MSIKRRVRRLEKQACAQRGGAAHIVVLFAGDAEGEHFGTVCGEEISREELRRRYPGGIAVIFDSDVPEPYTPHEP